MKDNFILIPKYFLIISGFWPFKITENKSFEKIYKIYSKFQTYVYILFILSLITNLCILIVRHDQPTRLFGSVNVLIIVGETCVKIVLFQVKKIPNLCWHIFQNEDNLSHSNDPEVKICYNKQTSYCRKVNLCQFLITLICCALFTLFSFLQLAAASEDMSEFKDQPFMHDMWYPFKRETHMFWVVSVNVFVVTQGLFFNTATQTTFISLMIYATARLKILRIRVEKFDWIAKEMNEGDVLRTIKELAVEHQHVIEFVTSLNQRTNYVMLLEFVLNSVSLASGIIQLVVVNTASGLLSVLSIVILVLVQIFVLAWSANEITIAGLGIADAVSASKWNEQTKEVKTLLMVIMMRAQIPIGLSVGPFFQMTTKTALMTLKIAYSYMSLMAKNYEE